MTGSKNFSHITVSTDEDDFVIQAGKKRSLVGQPSVMSKPVVRNTVSPYENEVETLQADKVINGGEKSDDEPLSSKSSSDYRQTQLEDLTTAPMPVMQKAVIGVAALLVVCFAVYYFFLR